MGSIEVFVQVDEKIEELETVEKVLHSAIEKEKLDKVSFNLIIVDNEYIHELARDLVNKYFQQVSVLSNVFTENKITLPFISYS